MLYVYYDMGGLQLDIEFNWKHEVLIRSFFVKYMKMVLPDQEMLNFIDKFDIYMVRRKMIFMRN